jgi:hypothetical protein
MILHRVIAHFRKHEWTAIAIEFIVVVAGVFVGLQVTNWNEAMATARRAEYFETRLVSDLREEAWGYEYLIEYNEDVLTNIARTIESLSGRNDVSDEQFLIHAYRATQYSFNDRKRATFDELISSGEIGLIADPLLRETAILVFSSPIFEIIMEDGRAAEYRALFRRSVPVNVQTRLLERCGDRVVSPGDYVLIKGSLDYQCGLDLSEAEISAAATALRNNKELLPALQLRASDGATARGLLTTTNVDMRRRLRAIAG